MVGALQAAESSGSSGMIIMLALVAGLMGLWSLVSPQSQWQVLSAWKYRNAEANEPSDLAYTLQRIGGAFTIVLAIYVAAKIA